jgi:ABC-type multidrug transport system fused ATPase/permease subunit
MACNVGGGCRRRMVTREKENETKRTTTRHITTSVSVHFNICAFSRHILSLAAARSHGQVIGFDYQGSALMPNQFDTISNVSKPIHDISVKELTYSHTPNSPPSLQNVSIYLPPGSRTILCGANGGK